MKPWLFFPKKVRLEAEVDGNIVTIIGPVDTDRDGDPEFFVAIQSTVFSIPSTKIEIPLSLALSAPLTALVGYATTELAKRGLFPKR